MRLQVRAARVFLGVLALLPLPGLAAAAPSGHNVSAELSAAAASRAGATSGPVILVAPTTLDFGVVNIGEVAERHYSIENVGSSDLEVVDIFSSDPQVTTSVPLPLIVEPGASFLCAATYAPAGGALTGYFEIRSNASQPTFVIGTRGRGNSAPTLEPIGDKSATALLELRFTVAATDLDSDPILLSVQGLPSGAVFDAEMGRFAWTPQPADAGVHQVTFTATDGSASDEETVGITVSVVIHRPVLHQPADMEVRALETADQTLQATDVDGNPLSFFKVLGPSYATVTTTNPGLGSAAGNVHVEPDLVDTGTTPVTVGVSDGVLSDQGSFTLSVLPGVVRWVDFETPRLENPFPGQQTINPYRDPVNGVTFTALAVGPYEGEVGLVTNQITSACVPGDPENQKLGGAPLGSGAIGFSNHPIRADFEMPLPPPCVVSVEFQTGAGGAIRLRLFDEQGNMVGAASGIAGPPLEPCVPGRVAPAVQRLTARTRQSVSYAVMDSPGSPYVSVIDDFVFTFNVAGPLTADVDLDPDTINLKSHAPWVTAYVEPLGFDLASIDPSTLRLAGVVAATTRRATVGDRDRDGVPDLMVKFAREGLDPLLNPGENDLELTGSLATGESFSGTGVVRVINPPMNPPTASVVPNPLNPEGVLTLRTSIEGLVTVRVFDPNGRLVRTLVDSRILPPGPHEVRIDSSGRDGNLASGVYLYRVETAEGVATGRFVVLK